MNNDYIDPQIAKRYKIEKKLGSGAYGHVWRVSQRAQSSDSGEIVIGSPKLYALKKVFCAFQNETDSQRTYRQVYLLQQLTHPNIICLYEVVPSASRKDVYLLFEYMNADLHNLIRNDLLQAIHQRYICYQMLLAVAYLHSAGIIHRDIKPSNILVKEDCTAKLCDFGLARYRSRFPTRPLTEHIATMWYRAPEILLSDGNYDEKVDMWSWGCVLGEVAMRRPMFPGTSVVNQIEIIMQYTEAREKYHPNSWEDLLQKVLRYDPRERYSAEQALRHPYFEGIYNEGHIRRFKGRIVIQEESNQHSCEYYAEQIFKLCKGNSRGSERTFAELKKRANSTSKLVEKNSFSKLAAEIHEKKRNSLGKKEESKENALMNKHFAEEKQLAKQNISRNNNKLIQNKYSKFATTSFGALKKTSAVSKRKI